MSFQVFQRTRLRLSNYSASKVRNIDPISDVYMMAATKYLRRVVILETTSGDILTPSLFSVELAASRFLRRAI